MNLQPYPEYKDSGAEWLGEIPASWRLTRVGQHFDERSETVSDSEFAALSVTMAGVVPQLENVAKTQNNDSRKLVRVGDFAINSRSDRKGSSGIADRDGSVSVITTVITPRDVVPAYVHHLFRSQAFQEEYYRHGSGIVADLWSTRWSAMKQILLAVPSMTEQATIAEFLDRETAEIDAFIADQEELIALLTERRAATITEHFNSVVQRQSSKNRIGSTSLKRVIEETDRRIGDGHSELLSVSIHRGVVPWTDIHEKPPKAEDFSRYKKVNSRDLVLNRMRAFQGAAGLARQDGMVSPDYAVFRISPDHCQAYIEYLFSSEPFVEAIKLRLRGIGDESTGTIRTPRINVRDLIRIELKLPTKVQQEAIVLDLSRETAEIDATIADAREAIALSKERRAALISAAVTGKIDVRQHGSRAHEGVE